MKNKIIPLIVCIALLLTSCNLLSINNSPTNPVGLNYQPNIKYVLATNDPNAEITPTPFLPLPITATPTQSETDTHSENQTATPTETPKNDQSIDIPDGVETILLLGSDYRPSSGYRTDVILLLILNPKNKTASMVSFPRDLYVTIPGWQDQRINTAMAYGGFSLVQDTFDYNFGIRPQHYVLTNFDGFRGIVDSLGGITINASRTLSDACDLPQAINGYCSVGPGNVYMDGDTALWYVRSRYSSDDFDRARRAQEVLQAIFFKVISLNGIKRAPELYNQYRSAIETDLSIGDILPLLPLAGMITDTSQIMRYTITRNEVTPWRTEYGSQVLLPNTAAIQEILRKAITAQP